MDTTASPIKREQRTISILKQVLATPMPVLMFGYVTSLVASMSGMEFFSWTITLFTVCYIVVDRFSSRREFKFFMVGADIAIVGLLIVVGIGLLNNPANPSLSLMAEFGSMRWILLLYSFSYAFKLFPSLNQWFYSLMTLSTFVAGYAIFQHFTGTDLRFEWGLRPEAAVTPAPFAGSDVFQSVGLFSHHLTFGYSFSMLICFPFAALAVASRKSVAIKVGFLTSVIVIGLALLWTYGRGVWIATAMALIIMTGFVSRKWLISVVLLLGTTMGIYYFVSPGFQERLNSIWEENYTSNSDRRVLWKANIQMFQENPWFGVGLGRNEFRTPEFYEKMGIKNSFAGHAHNVYFQWLSTTGFLGFAFYMIFILSFLMTSLRLWTEIPQTHYWHRVLILGTIGAQVGMHTGGLTQWNFGDAEVNHLFIFILAIVGYLSHEYTENIVPDDYAL